MKIEKDFDKWSKVYDIFYSTAPKNDIFFYIDMCKKFGGPILELGTGTGRILLPISNAGYSITGLDISNGMLSKIKSKIKTNKNSYQKIELLKADMKDFKLDKRFELILIPARTLLLETNYEKQVMVLKNAAAHLTNSGRIIFDIYYPDKEMINCDPDEEFLLGVSDAQKDGSRYILTGKNRFDTINQLNFSSQYIEKVNAHGESLNKAMLPVETRYLHFGQVVEMCKMANLKIDYAYGNFNYDPITETSDDMVFVCSKT
tara:strand:+ start:71 stop:850 length:780 start_codon:yes stop_codon:yes gene_type:complete